MLLSKQLNSYILYQCKNKRKIQRPPSFVSMGVDSLSSLPVVYEDLTQTFQGSLRHHFQHQDKGTHKTLKVTRIQGCKSLQ